MNWKIDTDVFFNSVAHGSAIVLLQKILSYTHELELAGISSEQCRDNSDCDVYLRVMQCVLITRCVLYATNGFVIPEVNVTMPQFLRDNTVELLSERMKKFSKTISENSFLYGLPLPVVCCALDV